MKYLGLIIDDRLKWDKQLMSVSRKLAMHNANLRRISKFVLQNILIQTYKSTVEPIMNYGCNVWGYASANVLNVINRLENKSARAITGNYDYINVRGDDIFNGLGLTRFQSRRDYFTSVLMFKAVHGITPHYISNVILFTFEVNERHIRSGDVMTFYKPLPHIDLYKSSLAYNGPHVWNNLSFNLRSALSLDTFKRSYKIMHMP